MSCGTIQYTADDFARDFSAARLRGFGGPRTPNPHILDRAADFAAERNAFVILFSTPGPMEPGGEKARPQFDRRDLLAAEWTLYDELGRDLGTLYWAAKFLDCRPAVLGGQEMPATLRVHSLYRVDVHGEIYGLGAQNSELLAEAHEMEKFMLQPLTEEKKRGIEKEVADLCRRWRGEEEDKC